jgi:uncharacterized membrane protein
MASQRSASVLMTAVLSGKILVERSDRHAGALGDITHPQGLAALFREDVGGRAQDQLAAFAAARLAGRARARGLAVTTWSQPGALPLLLGSLAYLAGMLLVTMVFNVPLNLALDAVRPETAAAATMWDRYLGTWAMWNHVRLAASMLASALYIVVILTRT